MVVGGFVFEDLLSDWISKILLSPTFLSETQLGGIRKVCGWTTLTVLPAWVLTCPFGFGSSQTFSVWGNYQLK